MASQSDDMISPGPQAGGIIRNQEEHAETDRTARDVELSTLSNTSGDSAGGINLLSFGLCPLVLFKRLFMEFYCISQTI